MQAVVDVPLRSTSAVSLMDAQCVAQDYVAAYVDPAFAMLLLRFEIGWEELDRQYAVIALAPPEDEGTTAHEDR